MAISESALMSTKSTCAREKELKHGRHMHVAEIHLHNQKACGPLVRQRLALGVGYGVREPWNNRVMPKRLNQRVNAAVEH